MGERREGFRDFFESEYPDLRRLAYRLTGDWTEAEDLAQEAMVRTWRAWKRIRTHERPGVYARAVLLNRHRSLLRRARVEARHRVTAHAEDASVANDDAYGVWTALRTLPARQREALVLRFYEDLPHAEIAEVLRCAVGTVDSLVHRGLARMRARLSDVEDPMARTEP